MREAKIKQIKSTVEDEFAQAIPQDTMKSIKKFSLDLASKVEQLQKTNARMKKQQEEIPILAQNRVPNGMKPVPYPYETAFLDSLMINRGEWKVELPENTNLREARKMIHCSYLRIMREIDHEIAKAQRVRVEKLDQKISIHRKVCHSIHRKSIPMERLGPWLWRWTKDQQHHRGGFTSQGIQCLRQNHRPRCHPPSEKEGPRKGPADEEGWTFEVNVEQGSGGFVAHDHRCQDRGKNAKQTETSHQAHSKRAKRKPGKKNNSTLRRPLWLQQNQKAMWTCKTQCPQPTSGYGIARQTSSKTTNSKGNNKGNSKGMTKGKGKGKGRGSTHTRSERESDNSHTRRQNTCQRCQQATAWAPQRIKTFFRQTPTPRQERKRERRSQWKKVQQGRKREGLQRAALVRMFLNYTMGMTAPELCVLLSCGKRTARSVFLLSWTVVSHSLGAAASAMARWICLAFASKSMFLPVKNYQLCQNWAGQSNSGSIRWDGGFSIHSKVWGQNHQSTRGWQKLRDRFATPLCPHRFCDQWEWFFHELKQGVFQQAFVMRNAAKFSDRRPSNFNRVARWGLQMLRSGPIGAVRTDKDGGYALVWKHALTQAILASLTLPHYEERFVHDQTFNDIASEHCGLAKYIGEQTDDDELVNSLLSSLKRGCKNFVTKVLTTVKTHKAEGEQSMRIVHAALRPFCQTSHEMGGHVDPEALGTI